MATTGRGYGAAGLELVWGNANFGGAMPTVGTTTPPGYRDALARLVAAGVLHLDTSRVYRQGKAEEWLGKALGALTPEQRAAAGLDT